MNVRSSVAPMKSDGFKEGGWNVSLVSVHRFNEREEGNGGQMRVRSSMGAENYERKEEGGGGGGGKYDRRHV